MGHHATYRKRGSAAAQVLTLPKPPAPTLTYLDGSLTQTATGLEDTDGQLKLYYSVVEGGPFTPETIAEWMPSYDWSEQLTIDPGYYMAAEIGNQTVYLGESDPSNMVHVTI